MVDLVYALHDFAAENGDELSFGVGEAIVVLERDDQYNDGWFQGRNTLGEVGLFPQSYTSISPPTDSPDLDDDDLASSPSSPETLFSFSRTADPVMEATMTDVQHALDTFSHSSGQHLQQPDTRSIGSRTSGGGAERNHSEGEDDVVAPQSSRTVDQVRGTALTKSNSNPRAMLAAKAVANAEKQARDDAADLERRRQEDELVYANSQRDSSFLPLQDVQMSDESDADTDDDEQTTHSVMMGQDKTARERISNGAGGGASEGEVQTTAKKFDDQLRQWSAEAEGSSPKHARPRVSSMNNRMLSSLPSARFDDDDPSLDNISALDASATSFSSPLFSPKPVEPIQSVLERPTSSRSSSDIARTHSRASAATQIESLGPATNGVDHRNESVDVLPAPILGSSSPRLAPGTPPAAFLSHRESFTSARSRTPSGQIESLSSPPSSTIPLSSSPARASLNLPPALTLPPVPTLSHSPTPTVLPGSFSPSPRTSESNEQPTSSPNQFRQSTMSPKASMGASAMAALDGLPYDPREWGVAEVLAWGRATGFDDLTLSKFEEHEISGDVLVEMDVAMLKEIDLAAFGKRVHIFNAIKQLKARIAQDPNDLYSPAASTTSGFMSPPTSFAVAMESAARSFEPSSRSSSMPHYNGDLTFDDVSPYLDHSGLKPRYPLSDGKASVSSSLVTSPALTSSFRSATQGSITSMNSLDTATPAEDQFASRASGRTNGRGKHSAKSLSVDSGSRLSSEDRTSKSGSSSPKKPKQERKFFGAAIATIGRARKPPPRVVSMLPAASTFEVLPASKPKIDARSSKRATRLFGSFGTSDKTASSLTSTQRSFTAPASTTAATTSSKRSGPSTMVERIPDAATSEMMTKQTSLVTSGNLLDKIGTPDYAGWMRKKGEKYNTWKQRYFVLKGVHLYYLKSETEHRVKGCIDLRGYRVMADAEIHVGEFGFKIVHAEERTHYFSAAEQVTIRSWMKEMMKSTIGRDYSTAVVSTCKIDTIPLSVAQTMNPRPRPPSPASRNRAEKERRSGAGNKIQTLTASDAAILMAGLDLSPPSSPAKKQPPGRGSRTNSALSVGTRTSSTPGASDFVLPSPQAGFSAFSPFNEDQDSNGSVEEMHSLLTWVNSNLSPSIQPAESFSDLRSGKILTRLVEGLSGRESRISDADFARFRLTSPSEPLDSDYLDTCFSVFDELGDAQVSTDDISINDILQGNESKLIELLERIRLQYPGRE